MRVLYLSFTIAVLSACGGAEPRAEATWETHTTAPQDEQGDEDGAQSAPEDDPADDPAAP